ncbi:(4Fe-4S)-binding protein [Streptomyces silaceus]|uniref:(4Fe-4S)-binding protein n=1 Tax=Streptomyces silaceus TaxID=545123 RepID=UPI0007C6FE42|nr:(4Fe-4S)-binding protein [Streptomyces silaceus]
MAAERGRPYRGDSLTVTFDAGRCIHAAECVRGLPRVFDTGRRPWIRPDAAPADEVAEVVRRCPSGALQYEPADGTAEPADPVTRVRRCADGRIVVRGDLRVSAEGGPASHETRVTLCGCGRSGNQPFCDHAGPCDPSRPAGPPRSPETSDGDRTVT